MKKNENNQISLENIASKLLEKHSKKPHKKEETFWRFELTNSSIRKIAVILIISAILTFTYLKTNQANEIQIEPALVENDSSQKSLEIQVNEIKVYVSGEVQKPGVYLLASGSRVIDALNKAGGLNKKGVIGENNLARQIEDGEQIDFPNVVHESKNFTKKSQKQNNCINLNTAQTSELEELPGVGPVLAERIAKWREENKKFNTVEDLSLVDGIGQSKLVKISEKACV